MPDVKASSNPLCQFILRGWIKSKTKNNSIQKIGAYWPPDRRFQAIVIEG
jgi:hypothetical protein